MKKSNLISAILLVASASTLFLGLLWPPIHALGFVLALLSFTKIDWRAS